MPRKQIYAWITGIALLIVLLVAIQIIWMKQAALVEKRETAMHAIKALRRTEEMLKNTNYCMITYSKLYMGPGEGFFMAHTHGGKMDTVHTFTNDEVFTHTDTMLYDISSVAVSQYPVNIDVQLRMRLMVDDTADFYREQEEFYRNAGKKRVIDRLATSRTIDSVFDMDIADSLLAANLKAENMDTAFGFGFINAATHKVVYARRVADTPELLKSGLAIDIFTDNKFIKPHRLALWYTNQGGTYKINKWLLSSVVIILLLAAGFFVFVRLYFNQVKLAEMKSDFINNLTHEFNTPIANISLALETLEGSSAIDSKTTKILGIVSTEAERLRDNIERALQVTSMDRGEIQLRKENTDLVALVNTILSSYQVQCEQLGGQVSFFHPEAAVTVSVDETHFLNSVCNLLDNAIKYRSGAPLIKITLKAETGYVALSIADNGIGMNSTSLKHIFEKFYRAPEGDVHNRKGFGLGLSYVKGVIDAHKGSIAVKSVIGEGTIFTIQIPA